VLILLPPSEGKSAPRRGATLDLAKLAFSALTEPRERILAALVEHCSTAPDRAAATLGLGPTQADLVARNAGLLSAPTARADAIYTGVLYDALDVATMSPAARRRAASRVAVTSSLFGVVRPTDRIPSYRLSGDATLPGLGPVAGIWRAHLGAVLTDAMGGGLLLDLRSTTYAAFWRPPRELAPRVATVRVLYEVGGRRTVVSHFNKATKGLLVRALLEEGDVPRTPGELTDVLSGLGWDVELGAAERHGTRVDVIVSEVGGS
jgi:cytoplasmic iron level regulating protein YaaA (DUF328/UPF0246 family)